MLMDVLCHVHQNDTVCYNMYDMLLLEAKQRRSGLAPAWARDVMTIRTWSTNVPLCAGAPMCVTSVIAENTDVKH